jgi:hypothetical protein
MGSMMSTVSVVTPEHFSGGVQPHTYKCVVCCGRCRVSACAAAVRDRSQRRRRPAGAARAGIFRHCV